MKIKLLLFLAVSLAMGGSLFAQNSATGNITASAATCVTSGTCVWENQLPFNASTTTINISGTFSATLLVEESNNGGQTWSTAATISTTGTTTYAVNGFTDIRVRCSAYTSGTAVVAISTGLNTGPQGPPGPAGGGSMTWPATPGVTVCTGTPCTAWGTSKATPTGALVGAGQANTFTTGLQDFSLATMKLPSSAAYAPTTAALIGYDSTNNRMVLGNGTNTSFIPWRTAAPATNTVPKSSGTLGLLADSLFTDDGTNGAYTGTGGFTAPLIKTSGSTAGGWTMTGGTANGVGAANTGTFEAPASITTPWDVETFTAAATGLWKLTNTAGVMASTIMPLQGTDANIMSAGTISGTAAPLCTDALGGATTSGCPGGGGSTLVTGSTSSNFGSGHTYFVTGAPATGSSTLGDLAMPTQRTGTAGNLQCHVGAALASGQNATITIVHNGSDSTVVSTCTGSGATTNCTADTTHTFTFVAGDTYSFDWLTTLGTPGTVPVFCSFTIQ